MLSYFLSQQIQKIIMTKWYIPQTLESGQLPPQYGGEVDRGTTPYRDGGFEPPNEIGPPSMDSPCLGYPSSIVEYASPISSQTQRIRIIGV